MYAVVNQCMMAPIRALFIKDMNPVIIKYIELDSSNFQILQYMHIMHIQINLNCSSGCKIKIWHCEFMLSITNLLLKMQSEKGEYFLWFYDSSCLLDGDPSLSRN